MYSSTHFLKTRADEIENLVNRSSHGKMLRNSTNFRIHHNMHNFKHTKKSSLLLRFFYYYLGKGRWIIT